MATHFEQVHAEYTELLSTMTHAELDAVIAEEGFKGIPQNTPKRQKVRAIAGYFARRIATTRVCLI